MRSMKSIISPFLFVFLNICYPTNSADDIDDPFKDAPDTWQSKHGEIIFSVMLFRHGHRTPFEDYPTNEHSGKVNRTGILTKRGKSSAHKLGIWTRKRYDHLIGGQAYHSELLNVISSSSERCAISAQLFLTGFYPPISEETEKWNANMLWQPIPVYTNPPADRMFTMREYCARYNYEMERVKNSPEIVNFFHKHKRTIDLIKERGKYNIPDDCDPIIRHIQRTSVFFDILHVENQLHLNTPDWAKEIYPRDKEAFVGMYYKLHTYNQEMKRIKGGPFLSHIINELKNKRENPQSEKLFQFYAGHDGNIVALLNSMDIWDGTLPDYSASLLFELRKLNEDYIVTVSFKPSENGPLRLMELPTCPNPCTLERFIEETKPVIPDDWDKECRTLTPDYNTILF